MTFRTDTKYKDHDNSTKFDSGRSDDDAQRSDGSTEQEVQREPNTPGGRSRILHPDTWTKYINTLSNSKFIDKTGRSIPFGVDLQKLPDTMENVIGLTSVAALKDMNGYYRNR
jgi:hypothetical protein